MAPAHNNRTSSPHQQRTEAPTHTYSFTAVNGANAVNGRASPTTSEDRMQIGKTPTSPSRDSQKMNGVVHQNQSPKSSNSPPSMNDSLDPAQADTPDSQRSPPRRKRSYPEAFGDHERRDGDRDPHSRDAQRGAEYSRANQEDCEMSEDGERDRKPPSGVDPHASMGHNYYLSRSQAPGDSEQRLAAAALRRESEGSITRKDLPAMLPNSEDPSRQQYSDYDRNGSAVQVDSSGKRRKRIFSNRTKTGCMTCRKRKKKCDELHPECKRTSFSFPPRRIRMGPKYRAAPPFARGGWSRNDDSACAGVAVSRCLSLLRLPTVMHISEPN